MSSDMPSSRWLPSLARSCLPVRLGQVVDVLGAERRPGPGASIAGGQDRPVRDEVGVDARVRLDVGVRRAEQLRGVLGGQRLDGVDVLAAGVEPVPDGALGVLVGEPGAHGQQHRRRRVVLAGDQLERIPLVGKLFARGGGDAGFDGLDDLQRRAVGGARGVGVLGARRRCGGRGTWDLQSCRVCSLSPDGPQQQRDGISGSSSSLPNRSVRLTPSGRASSQPRSSR